jgi:hypothetical protein
MKHLYEFADKACVDDRIERKQWCDRQRELLPDSKVESVPDNINLTSKEEDRKKLMHCYENNKKRMRYKQYRNMWCGIIGSGAIESARRTVIQTGMKLSGQRWSRMGG